MKLTIAVAATTLFLASPTWADPGAAGGFLATITYVKARCPQYQVNELANTDIMRRLGQNPKAWGKRPPDDVIIAAEAVWAKLNEGDPGDVCARIWNEFGVSGEMFPGTLLRK